MPNSSFIEKRAFPRFPIAIPLTFIELELDKITHARTHDISAQGLCVITDKVLPPGDYLDILIRMIDNQEKIYKKGKVVWTEETEFGKYKIGIKLDEPKLNAIPLVLRTIMSQRKY